MNQEIYLLGLLYKVNSSLFEAKNSSIQSINAEKNITEYNRHYLNKKISTLNETVKDLDKEVAKTLNMIPIYIGFLRDFRTLSMYDVSDIIITIKDINKYKTANNLLGHAGICPNPKQYNKDLKRMLNKVAQKIIVDPAYLTIYEISYENDRDKNPHLSREHLINRARLKMIKVFVKKLFKEWKRLENANDN